MTTTKINNNIPNQNNRVAIIGRDGEWSALPIIRYLGRRGLRCYALFTSNNIVRYSKYTHAFVLVKSKTPSKLVKEISIICQKKKISRIICLHDEIKNLVNSNLNLFPNVNFAGTSRKSYQVAHDKSQSTEFVKGLGIPVPDTDVVSSLDDIEKLNLNFGNCKVVKGIGGVSSENVRYAYDINILKEHVTEMLNRQGKENYEYNIVMIQDYIGGPTFLTHGIAQQGVTKIVVPQYKFREWPTTGGISCKAKTIEEPRLVAYVKRIIEKLEWNGEFGMEWKYDGVSDDYYFIEINPRFEGSVDLAMKAGVDMVGLLIDIMDGREIGENIVYRKDVYYRWFFRKDFRSYLSKPNQSVFRYLFESFDPRINGELAFDDLGILKGFWRNPFKDIIWRVN